MYDQSRVKIINLSESDRFINILARFRGETSSPLRTPENDIEFEGGKIIVAKGEAASGKSLFLLSYCIKFIRQEKDVLYLAWDGTSVYSLGLRLAAIANDLPFKIVSENPKPYMYSLQDEVRNKLNINVSSQLHEVKERLSWIKEFIDSVDIIFIDGQCESLESLQKDTLNSLLKILPRNKMIFLSCQTPFSRIKKVATLANYKFQRRHYRGTDIVEFKDIPKDIEFCKVNELSESQQKFIAIIPNTEELSNKFHSLAVSQNPIGEFNIIEIDNVKPIDDIPMISLQDLRNKHESYLQQFCIQHIGKDSKLKVLYKLLELRGDTIRCGIVRFTTLIENKECDIIEVDDVKLSSLFHPVPNDGLALSDHCMIPSNTLDVKNKFDDRVKEILKKVYPGWKC